MKVVDLKEVKVLCVIYMHNEMYLEEIKNLKFYFCWCKS
jgi:hypothetical protein